MTDEEGLFDVAIVGLGPVGAVAAQLLAREGLSVAAIEPALVPYDKPRAIGMDHEALRLLQKLGITDELSLHMGPYKPSEYRSGAGEILRRIIPQAEPYPLSWPPYCTFVQPELERLLREGFPKWDHLLAMFGWQMTEIEQVDTEVRILVTQVDTGQTRQIRSRYLIGCDGAWSPVREAMDLQLEDLQFDEPWLVIDMRVNELADLPDATIQYCDPSRPCTFVHGPGNLRRWEIMLLPGEDPAVMREEGQIWRLLSRWLTPEQGTIWRAATYRFHALVGKRWQNGRVFIAGDAAHQTPPFMAQGLNQGLRDAGNLCWKLGEVVAGRAAPRLLESYDEERRPNARAVIELTKTFGSLICERDPVAAADRDRKMLEEMHAGRGEIVRQDLLPPLNSGFLLRDGSGAFSPGTGTIFPQPWIEKGGVTLRMDDAFPCHYLMIVPGTWKPSSEDSELADSLSVTIATVDMGEIDPRVLQMVEKGDLIAAWMARYGQTAVLVRPDHVVYGSTGETGGERTLLHALAGHLREGAEAGDAVNAARTVRR